MHALKQSNKCVHESPSDRISSPQIDWIALGLGLHAADSRVFSPRSLHDPLTPRRRSERLWKKSRHHVSEGRNCPRMGAECDSDFVCFLLLSRAKMTSSQSLSSDRPWCGLRQKQFPCSQNFVRKSVGRNSNVNVWQEAHLNNHRVMIERKQA